MKPKLPSPESLDAVALWSLCVSFERRLADELGPMGLTVAGFRLVGEVMREPDGIRQGELARRLGVRPPTVSAAVRRLEAHGMLHRRPDPKDPRARLVCLSPDASLLPGLEVLARMEEILFGAMTVAERSQARTLIQTLSKLLETP
jgi:DNA-binding MarR family transcriptional regulator